MNYIEKYTLKSDIKCLQIYKEKSQLIKKNKILPTKERRKKFHNIVFD